MSYRSFTTCSKHSKYNALNLVALRWRYQTLSPPNMYGASDLVLGFAARDEVHTWFVHPSRCNMLSSSMTCRSHNSTNSCSSSGVDPSINLDYQKQCTQSQQYVTHSLRMNMSTRYTQLYYIMTTRYIFGQRLVHQSQSLQLERYTQPRRTDISQAPMHLMHIASG